MNNKVIKVLNEEHGRKVIKFFKQYCDTGILVGDSIGDYYGIIVCIYHKTRAYYLACDLSDEIIGS